MTTVFAVAAIVEAFVAPDHLRLIVIAATLLALLFSLLPSIHGAWKEQYERADAATRKLEEVNAGADLRGELRGFRVVVAGSERPTRLPDGRLRLTLIGSLWVVNRSPKRVNLQEFDVKVEQRSTPLLAARALSFPNFVGGSNPTLENGLGKTAQIMISVDFEEIPTAYADMRSLVGVVVDALGKVHFIPVSPDARLEIPPEGLNFEA